jgi:DNA-binding MarR family transcriptional regulator
MTEADAPRRDRDSLLAALELFRGIEVPRSLTTLILFLYVCENEGLNVSELALAGGIQVAGAARLVKTLAGLVPEEPVAPEAVLFELKSTPRDRRLRFIHLSPRGRALRDQLETLIARATPINPRPTVLAAE